MDDADALSASLDQLLAKKRLIKHGAMQELLTGKRRLSGLTGDWSSARVGDIARPSSSKNDDGRSLPVLTCSKHLGFVDSLSYFKNQVFSRDTTGYRLIRRGELGYPSNHVEEGSIGLQETYDLALVSPIYVVFAVKERVDSYFLHRLLKLDSYRQRFAVATSASVDRRGSLRWPAFSRIEVRLPDPKEQLTIAAVLREFEAEIAALEVKLALARYIKQGMMQNLLTGMIDRWQPRIGVEARRLFVQRMRTKWGSCHPESGNIRLNTELAKKPLECLEYVVVHELIHLVEPTHNQRFVELMDRWLPRWRQRRAALNRLPVRHEDWLY